MVPGVSDAPVHPSLIVLQDVALILPSSEPAISREPTSPLVLDTHELSRRAGSMRMHSAIVQAPSDLGTAVIGIPEGSDLELDLRLESVMEGVLVSGTVRGTAKGECGRCLDDISREITVDVTELFTYPERGAASSKRGADADEPDSDDDEEFSLDDDDMADLEPSLRDSVVTALPFQPLCREDCPGLCSECGARLADDPGHHHDVVDPRWSALQSMLESTSVSDETKES